MPARHHKHSRTTIDKYSSGSSNESNTSTKSELNSPASTIAHNPYRFVNNINVQSNNTNANTSASTITNLPIPEPKEKVGCCECLTAVFKALK